MWTQDQVDSLNAFQRAGVMHPFTCGICRGDLVARQEGWYCPNDTYTQDWAHGFMMDWSWCAAASYRRYRSGH